MRKKTVKTILKQQKAGFTLLELLIVIMIMAIMTMIAVNAFSLVQKQMKVDFAAESLISTIKEAQVLVKSGRRAENTDGSTGSAICYVVRIGAAADSGLFTGKSNYVAVGDSAGGVAIVDVCTVLSKENMIKKDIFSENIKIKAILQDGLDIAAQEFYFKPPFGQLYQLESGQMKPVVIGKFVYLIGYDQEEQYDQKVQFDTATGEVKRL